MQQTIVPAPDAPHSPKHVIEIVIAVLAALFTTLSAKAADILH